MSDLWFGPASAFEELEQIFRLNHATFTAEIPQYPARDDGLLVDRFHDENEYVICKDGNEVVGMLALRDRRPFSLDEKLQDLDRYLPAGRRVCEIRLLAIRPGYRRRRVLPGLIRALVRRCRERGLDYAVISGTLRQLRLYAHLGFQAFGPITGAAEARFQPMGISIERFSGKVAWLNASASHFGSAQRLTRTPMRLLPGPIDIHPQVLAAFASRPDAHRSPAVAAMLEACRRRLTQLTHADDVQILLGSGTLANDAIAQQLRLLGTSGVVFSNGEFGDRLIDHAHRSGLAHRAYRARWGDPFDYPAVREYIAQGEPPAWMWMAHCETSTGVLNDLEAFRSLATESGADAVLDVISSIGNVDVDLRDIAFASGVSGKGLAALAGLAFVFHRRNGLRTGPLMPRYLDLALYASHQSIPFTHSSNLLAALDTALDHIDRRDFGGRVATSTAVRAALQRHGFRLVDNGESPAHFVVTIELPPDRSSLAVGEAMLERGVEIAFRSAYLQTRNWIQVAWMGEVTAADALSAIEIMAEVCREGEPRTGSMRVRRVRRR